MTWAMIGASAVAVVGSMAAKQIPGRGGAGGMPAVQPQLPDQKTPPLQPTAPKFEPPPVAGGTPQVPGLDPKAAQALVMQSVPQSDPLGDYLKHRQGY